MSDPNHLKTFQAFAKTDLLLGLLGLLAGSVIELLMTQLDAIAQGAPAFRYFLGLIQFLINAGVLFIFATKYPKWSGEFQSTYSGLFFVALFFNSQTGFVYRMQLPFT